MGMIGIGMCFKCACEFCFVFFFFYSSQLINSLANIQLEERRVLYVSFSMVENTFLPSFVLLALNSG